MSKELLNALTSFRGCLNKQLEYHKYNVRKYPESKRMKSDLKKLYKIDKLVKKMEDLL